MQNLNIYTDINDFMFFEQLFPNHNISYKKIKDLKSTKEKEEGGLIIFKKNIKEQININFLKKKYVIIASDKNLYKNHNKNLVILKPPLHPNQIKQSVSKFLINTKYFVTDFLIIENKIINNENKNKYAFLTDIEKKILIYIIENKNCTKVNIKQQVLQINKNVETNSIESHLTRIRKKLENIDTKLTIRSKNDRIFIH